MYMREVQTVKFFLLPARRVADYHRYHDGWARRDAPDRHHGRRIAAIRKNLDRPGRLALEDPSELLDPARGSGGHESGSNTRDDVGRVPVIPPTSRSALLPPKPDCVEVGACRIIGGVRPQNFDVAYRPDGVRFAFDSKTLNDTNERSEKLPEHD